MKIISFLLIVLLNVSIAVETIDTLFISEDLQLIRISEKTFVHKSFTESKQFGRFSSNGMVFINKNEAIIFDTPVDLEITEQLLRWTDSQKLIVKGVVVNHFHNDALGGLPMFHTRGITSYSNSLTKILSEKNTLPVPITTFEDSLTILFGDKIIINKFFGEAHTIDNIVSWIPSEKILFGGCMIKSLQSGKGNLDDANVIEWPETLKNVKEEFPDAKFVIPGHGQYGDMKLVNYTIDLFKK